MNSAFFRDDYELPPSPSIWHRLNRLLWVLLILALVATVIAAFLPELERQRNERDERARLHRLIDVQRTLHTRKENEIRWLQNDPEYLGIIARDRLGLMKEGETIFITEPAKPAAGPSAKLAAPPVHSEKTVTPVAPHSSHR